YQLLEQAKNQADWISIFVPPALYSSAISIIVAEEIQRCSKDKIIIATSGFSSLMVALYAQYATVQKVEWVFYELAKKLDEAKPFSNSWKNHLKDFIKEQFEGKYFSDL